MTNNENVNLKLAMQAALSRKRNEIIEHQGEMFKIERDAKNIKKKIVELYKDLETLRHNYKYMRSIVEDDTSLILSLEEALKVKK